MQGSEPDPDRGGSSRAHAPDGAGRPHLSPFRPRAEDAASRLSADLAEARRTVRRVHAEWLRRDEELRLLLREMEEPLARVDAIRAERDEAIRHASDLEARCCALESRFEHRAMRRPRSWARALRSLVRGPGR